MKGMLFNNSFDNSARGMPKTSMPHVERDFDGREDTVLRRNVVEWKWIKASATSTSEEDALCGFVLYQKIIGMKFNENIVIRDKVMNR